MARNVAAHAKELKEFGAKYCDCAACNAAAGISYKVYLKPSGDGETGRFCCKDKKFLLLKDYMFFTGGNQFWQ